MKTAPRFAAIAKALVRPALWFCVSNLLVAVLGAQCTNVTQVPNQTISSGTTCYSNNDTLTAAGVAINGSASVTFVAGHTVHLAPGFRAKATDPGAAPTTFHAWVETAPSVISVVPSSGSGVSQQFTWTVSSPSGYANLAHVFALFNTSVSGANGCYIYYSRGANSLFLADNSGTTMTGGFYPGSSYSASNSYCTIYGSGSSVTASGNQLSVTVNVAFQSSTFSGTKNNYLNVYDSEGLYTGWQQMGIWTVPATQYSLAATINPPGAGAITLNPPGGWYNSGTQVAVTATANPGYQFTGFSGSLTGGSPGYVTMNSNKSVTANFAATPQYSLTTAVSQPGAGTITLNPPGGWYNSGTQVQVLAAPAAGYTFVGFTGNLTGTVLPQSLVMNGNKSVTANFAATPPGQYSLTTSVNTAGVGTISPGAGSYNSGSQVTVTATPTTGYQFTGFTGSVNSGSNPITVTMNTAMTVTANFASVPSGPQSFSFPYTDANDTTRTWTITTEGLGHVFTWDSSHWTYEPSVVMPSPQTDGKYVLIFSAGTTYGQEGIYVATSDSPTGPFLPSPPTEVLHIGGNLCDIINAVPYWDDARQIWHVYVQGIKWVSGACPEVDNGMYEATGPSLTSLSWVMDPNNPSQALELVSPTATGIGKPGIGEKIQWFNSTNYLGAVSVPFVVTFNDWSYVGQDCLPYNPNGAYVCREYCPLCYWDDSGGNGAPVFAYAGPDGTSPLYFWYYRQGAWGNPNNNSGANYYPDIILSGSLDAATAGNPGFGLESEGCGGFRDEACPASGVGFFPDPVPYANPNYLPYNGGFYFPGPLSSASATGIMYHPRVARNLYGYIDPVPASSPRTWQTYLYYTDCDWQSGRNFGCGFGASLLTITQQ